MSKSTLKLKYFEIFNLANYFQGLNDDIMQDEEDIIDIVYELSAESKFVYSFLLLLSKGTLLYFEYNTTTKKITKVFPNPSLSMITNELICSELSFHSPIIVATSLNEIILVETKQKPCQMIQAKEEGISICSVPCDSRILSIKFNCNQTMIFVVTVNKLKIFKIVVNKIAIDGSEAESSLEFFTDIELEGLDDQDIDYSKLLNQSLFFKLSDFNENAIVVSYITEKSIMQDPIKLSFDSDEITDNNNNPNASNIFLNIVKININKKDYKIEKLQSYSIDKSFVKIEFSYFYEKLFILFEEGVICCINSNQLNTKLDIENPVNNEKESQNTKNDEEQKPIYDNKLIFKYPLNSQNVKFTDLYVHPSSNFIVVRDSQNTFLIFDFTLNLYYIMYNSQIMVKLNMDLFDANEEVKFVKFKPYELNVFVKNYNALNHVNILNDVNLQNEFSFKKEIKAVISNEKFINNSMFFYNSKIINGIFIEISSSFNQKNTLNPILDEFQLLKNHLRGQNFDSSFKILPIISDFQQWIHSLFLITNKICHNPQNILLIKRHSLATALNYLKDKTFNDEEKNNTISSIRNLCFTNIVLRCLSIRQYEYAYLIIDSLNINYLLKLLMSHCKLTKFLGVNYLACTKLESENENEDNIISELNKIITSTNFTLSQNNMQLLIKDIDELIENDSLNTEYLKDYNSLEINLPKYYEGLQMEMEGRFEEAKELYKQNSLNFDFMRVEKLSNELAKQISEDSILEFNDIKLDKDN